MNSRPSRTLVVQAAGLGYDLLRSAGRLHWNGLQFGAMEPVFPGLTCVAQASFRTASPPSRHGMVANGFYHADLHRPLFWEQSSDLVAGPRIWDRYRAAGKKVAILFWQQSLGENADIILSPAPIHKHGGGLVDAVYSRPAGLYESLCRRVGRRFKLHQYWGPLASSRSSAWIADAAAALLADPLNAPDLCLVYLPALDYDLQRHGSEDRRSHRALADLLAQLDVLHRAAGEHGYDMIVYGDYAIAPANAPLFPNLILRRAGLFATRTVGGRLYPDFHAARAFAIADHEVAFVYSRDPESAETARRAIEGVPGIGPILDRAGQCAAGLLHPRSGALTLVAQPGHWFAYPWWEGCEAPPDYAAHIDIHSKPGYDPCELFFGWPPMTVSTNPHRIKGSHGRTGPDRKVAWAATSPLAAEPSSLTDLALLLQRSLETTP
jgi:predicted AlkP superfamily pyrophosphatase or phosphodiesterase